LHREYSSFFARNRWWIIAAAIVAAVVLLAAFNSMRGDIIPVRAAGVVRGRIRSLISTNGKIEPIQNFEAHSPVATTITSAAKAIAQLRGAQADIHAVTHGGTREEVLTTDAQLVKAQADRDNAQRNLDAFERLQKDGAASAGEVRAAEAEYNTALANLNLLEQKRKARYSPPEVAKVEAQQSEAQAAYDAAQDILSKSNIRAPFDGVVYALPVQQGNYVSPGQLLLEEADLSKVRLRAFVDEPDVGRLAPRPPRAADRQQAASGRHHDAQADRDPPQDHGRADDATQPGDDPRPWRGAAGPRLEKLRGRQTLDDRAFWHPQCG